MPIRNTVIGQDISSAMRERAKELRRNMTPAEKILWQALKANRLSGLHFRRQQVIGGYIADFYCHEYALIIEIDGNIHELQKEYDANREAKLTAQGFKLIRFTNEEILRDLTGTLKRILDSIQPSDSPFPFREGGRGDRSGAF